MPWTRVNTHSCHPVQTCMQRTYSMFPLGAPGVGLVLLRLCLATALWLLQGSMLSAAANSTVFWSSLCISLALLIGLLTPVACALCIVLASIALLSPDHPLLMYVLSIALDAFALLLLGPGAYSVDARLYGHRVLTITDKK